MARLFSTQFPLNNEKTLDDLLQITENWIITSKHNPFTEEEIKKLNADSRISKEGYTITLSRYADDRIESLGLRLNIPDKHN